MSTTITGYSSNTVNLTPPAYTSPTTIAGTIDASNNAVDISTAWSLDVTGTLVSTEFFGIFATAPATISNTGIIHAQDFSGIFLNDPSSVTNLRSGHISGGLQAIYSYYKTTTTISNAGYIGSGETAIKQGFGLVDNQAQGSIIAGTMGVDFTQTASLRNAGLIIAQDYGGTGVTMPGGFITNTGSIIGQTGITAAGGVITNAGYIAGETLNSYGLLGPSAYATAINFTAPGLLVENAGGVLLGSISGDGGTLQLGATSLAGLGQTITGFSTDAFTPNEPATLTGFTGAFGTVTGFAPGDELHLIGLYATGGHFTNNVLDLTEAGFFLGAAITFAGSYASADFTVQIDPNNGGTDITIACFLAGTRITTVQGEVPVETLKIGDILPTLHGGSKPIKWIGRRRYNARFAATNPNVLPIVLRAGALAPGIPARDLLVSPGHAVFVEGALIPARNLVNGVSISEAPVPAELHYFHIELDSHEIILAENCQVETFLDTGCRAQFENYVEYLHRHPTPAPAIANYPLLEDGFTLAALHTRLAQRAGLNPTPQHGRLRGYLDSATPTRLTGWAQCSLQPDLPVCLDVLANGTVFTRIIANRHRADLRALGLGRGFSGFDLTPSAPGPYSLRRSFDHAPLGHAEKVRTSFCEQKEAKKL